MLFPKLNEKFLLDENVHRKLYKFLKSEEVDIKHTPKGLSNGKVASISKKEKRILVTNDSDFTEADKYSKDDLYAVIWLRIPQNKVNSLLSSFKHLLVDFSDNFEGSLIILKEHYYELYSLGDVMD